MRTKKEVEAAPEGPVFHHINKAATTTIADPSQPQKASRLPPALRFPLVVVLSFSLSSLGYSFLREWTDGELAKVARPLDGWAEIAVLAGWRMFVFPMPSPSLSSRRESLAASQLTETNDFG